MEKPTTPMHVGSVAVIEDPGLDFEAVCDHIDRRLALVPRFRRKLMWVPYHQGRPVWVDDEHFDVRYHVRHSGLPHPAGERELLTSAARILSTHLDRKRPLWEFWILDLPDGRKALIQKTHHALIDGISGVDVATVLLDLTPDSPATEPSTWVPASAPSKPELLRRTLLERAAEPAEIVRTIRAATRRPRRFLQEAIETG
ncbi:MAG: wax ester/triacylglycerol synthase family O-acyltransferase, partial [Actinobacteria bacterium ATB1]|nr:wax ester/triacylglycerol synthase family O-acyltransferase [Actinobacteria bacterium ATB1]